MYNCLQLLQLTLLFRKRHFVCKLVGNKKQYLLPATLLDYRQLKTGDKHTSEVDTAKLFDCFSADPKKKFGNHSVTSQSMEALRYTLVRCLSLWRAVNRILKYFTAPISCLCTLGKSTIIKLCLLKMMKRLFQ